MWPSAKQTQREQKWRRGIMKSSDSELQVLMDEAQGKNGKDRISLCQRGITLGMEFLPARVMSFVNATPTDCEGWDFDLRGRKEEVTIIRPFIQPFLSEALLGQVGVASWSDCWSASVGSLRDAAEQRFHCRSPTQMAKSLRYLFIRDQPLIGGNAFQPFGPFGHHPNTTAHRPKPPVYLLLHPSSSPLWTRTPAPGTVVIFVIFQLLSIT